MLHSDQDAWRAPEGAGRWHREEAVPGDEAIEALAREIEAMQRQQSESMAMLVGRLRALEERPRSPSGTAGEEPWDPASAEALMQTYESQAAAPPTAGPDAPPSQEWMGHRLSDAADRMRRLLSDLKPGGTMALLEERLDQFQRHISSALEDVVRRHDLDGLRQIEAHVADLGDRLQNLEHQLARLDGLEADVRSVIDQVSDERIAKLLDSSPRLAADLEAVALRAAEETQARFGRPAEPDTRLHDELRAMIEASIQERRAADAEAASLVNGLTGRVSAQDERYEEIKALIAQATKEQRQSEQTAIGMLDTLQQALVQVLDRIDVLEEQRKPQASAQPMPPPVPPAFAAAAQSYPAASPIEEAVSVRARRFESTPPALPASARPASHEADPSTHGEPDEAHPQFDRMRRDFVADARRAKLKAAANRAETVSAKPKDSMMARSAGTARAALSRVPLSGSGGRLFGASPKLLAAALALVIAINGGILLINRKGTPPAPAVTVLPSDAPAAEFGSADDGTSLMDPAADAPVGPRSFLDSDSAETGSTASTDEMPRPYGLQDDILDPPALGADAAPAVVPSGVTIARPPGSMPDDVVAGVYEDQVLASLSGRLGNLVAGKSTDALLPDANGRIEANYSKDDLQAVASTGPERVNGLDLPPATVGPLSLRLAAANGDASAEFEVAARLAEGKGTEQNYAEALRWYQRSAGKGFAQAQYRLGTFYERGLGVAQDVERAKVWYTRAAEQGNVKSMHNLAVLAAGSDGGNPDYPGAIKWFAKAAEHGLADSQYNLGVLLENGLGAKVDKVMAYKWYALAAKSGDADALGRRDALKAAFSAEDLKFADQLVVDFKVRPSQALANDARAAGEDWKKRANNNNAAR